MANTGGRLIPALTAATVISAALLVLAVVVTGPVSLCLRGRWRAVRLSAFLVTYLALESTSLAGALAIWVRCGPAWRRDAIRYQDLDFRLIEQLLARLYRAACWLFGLRVEVHADQHERQEASAGALPGPSSCRAGRHVSAPLRIAGVCGPTAAARAQGHARP
jgi:hypothetical protein